MIKSVTVINFKNESLKLTLTNPEDSGLIIESIDGLGPSKANINSTELATMDGSVFNSARQEERNIVISLIMMFAPTIEDARQKVYKYFPMKKLVKIQVETDNRFVETEGYVESNEPDIFSDQESTQISIICPDPYFYAVDRKESKFSYVDPLFEFPFSNESVSESLIEFGSIRLDRRVSLTYPGDTDVGIVITVHALGTVKNFSIFNVDTREYITIDTNKIETITGKPYSKEDDVLISTIKGQKYVRLLRKGKYYNIIGALDRNSEWFQLLPGVNEFGFSAEEGEEEMVVSFNYRIAYGGI